MAHAYTPGLLAAPRMRHRARRMLPIPGQVLVAQGAAVRAEQIVARTELPGDVTPLNVANLLSIPASDVPGVLLKREGDTVEKGAPLARTKGLFGFFQQELPAPVSGTIESISSVTGQIMLRGAPLPVEVRAHLTGTIVEVAAGEGVVVEASVSLVQGIFGIGGEAYGRVRFVCETPQEELSAARVPSDCRGDVLIGGARIHGDAVRKAIDQGAAAIVSGGIDDADLKAILGYDLGVAITGSETVGLTMIITEGFGDIAMATRTFELLRSRNGAAASLNGATQIRAGVMRPEIAIPVDASGTDAALGEAHGGGVLQAGSGVRIIRDPYFGVLGVVSALPAELRTLETGSKARVVEVDCRDGRRVVVPRANVEILGAE